MAPIEGRVDDVGASEYGPNDPFWRTSMGQSISDFGVIRPSFEDPPLNEEEYRIIQGSLNCACKFQERMEMDRDTPIN